MQGATRPPFLGLERLGGQGITKVSWFAVLCCVQVMFFDISETNSFRGVVTHHVFKYTLSLKIRLVYGDKLFFASN